MKRTLILLLVVVGLAGLGYFIVQENDQPVSSVVGADREFSVPREQVHKIFIATRNGNTTTLTRTQGDEWMYNGEYKARPDAINSLLIAVDKIRMRFKPTEAAKPHLIESLATEGLKVEIYGKNDELLKTYYIGGATNDERGVYVILDGAEQPYVAEIPGWEGNLLFRYNLLGDDWRDRQIFHSKASDIAEISVEYPKQQDKSFRLDVSGDQPVVTPFYPLSDVITKPLRAGSVEAYLDQFASITAAGFNNFNRDREALSQQVPFATISLKEKNGKEYQVTFFPRRVTDNYDPKTGITTTIAETSGFYALTQDNDFMTTQNIVLKDILWGYEFFY